MLHLLEIHALERNSTESKLCLFYYILANLPKRQWNWQIRGWRDILARYIIDVNPEYMKGDNRHNSKSISAEQCSHVILDWFAPKNVFICPIM